MTTLNTSAFETKKKKVVTQSGINLSAFDVTETQTRPKPLDTFQQFGGQTISQAPPKTLFQKGKDLLNQILPGTRPEEDQYSDVGIRVKVPLLNRTFKMPNTMPDQFIGGMVEWPEGIVNTISDLWRTSLNALSPELFKEKDTRENTFFNPQVLTAFDTVGERFDEAKDAGYSDNMATGIVVIGVIADIILTLAPAADVAARGVLALTKFNPAVSRSLYRLGLERNFTVEQWGKNTKAAYDDMVRTGDFSGAKQLYEDSLNISRALQDKGIFQTTGITRYIEDIAKKLTQPIGTKTPTRYTMPKAPEESLPGFRPVPGTEPAFNMGLSVQPIEEVGRGFARGSVSTDVAIKGLTSKVTNLESILANDPFDDLIVKELEKTRKELADLQKKVGTSVVSQPSFTNIKPEE